MNKATKCPAHQLSPILTFSKPSDEVTAADGTIEYQNSIQDLTKMGGKPVKVVSAKVATCMALCTVMTFALGALVATGINMLIERK